MMLLTGWPVMAPNAYDNNNIMPNDLFTPEVEQKLEQQQQQQLQLQ